MENKTIIICDDDEVSRLVIRRQLCLKIENLFIGDANNGTELEEVIKSKMPDVIIMDISMSGEDGISLTKRLIKKNNDLNIIICSSNKDINSVISSFNAGAKGFFDKNSTNELCCAIKYLLQEKPFFSNKIKICNDNIAKLVNINKNLNFNKTTSSKELTLQVF